MAEMSDLTGYTRMAFLGFDEEVMYLERQTVPDREEAIEIIWAESGIAREEIQPKPIWMQQVSDPDDPRLAEWGSEFTEAWFECDEDAEGAIPFWKDDPSV